MRFGLKKLAIIIIAILLCGAIGAAFYYSNTANKKAAEVEADPEAAFTPGAAVYTIDKVDVDCKKVQVEGEGEASVCTGSIDVRSDKESKNFEINSETTYSVKGARKDISEVSNQSGKQAYIESQGDKASYIDIK